MSDHEDWSILSASVIKDRPNNVAFDCLLDYFVNFIEENLVSLLLSVRGYLVFSLLKHYLLFIFVFFLTFLYGDILSHAALWGDVVVIQIIPLKFIFFLLLNSFLMLDLFDQVLVYTQILADEMLDWDFILGDLLLFLSDELLRICSSSFPWWH